jgi:N4-(beta-N-acetylglucosaminyl)-L-asparaginase
MIVGYGGSPDSNGESTLDALVMDGKSMKSGAVANLRYVKEATQVAREVYRRTKHSLLVGSLATDFAVTLGYTKHDNISSEWAQQEYKKWLQNGCQPNFWIDNQQPAMKCQNNYHSDNGDTYGIPIELSSSTAHSHADDEQQQMFSSRSHDTIGMIALQSNGDMAIGTSSNGAKYKIAGRVGDSPIVGSGGYVDDTVGACVATGDGDILMRFSPSFWCVEMMRVNSHTYTPEFAAVKALAKIAFHYPQQFSGAILCMNNQGQYGAASYGFKDFSYSVYRDPAKGVEVIPVKPFTLDQLKYDDDDSIWRSLATN